MRKRKNPTEYHNKPGESNIIWVKSDIKHIQFIGRI